MVQNDLILYRSFYNLCGEYYLGIFYYGLMWFVLRISRSWKDVKCDFTRFLKLFLNSTIDPFKKYEYYRYNEGVKLD